LEELDADTQRTTAAESSRDSTSEVVARRTGYRFRTSFVADTSQTTCQRFLLTRNSVDTLTLRGDPSQVEAERLAGSVGPRCCASMERNADPAAQSLHYQVYERFTWLSISSCHTCASVGYTTGWGRLPGSPQPVVGLGIRHQLRGL